MIRLNLIFIICFISLVAARPLIYEVGDNVENFTLKNVDGKSISLSNYNSEKGVIIIFDCNTCPYSKAYNARIIALHKKYKSQGFSLVLINANDPKLSPGDSFDEMVAYAKKKAYDFPYLVDETQNVARVFGATNTPQVFVLQKEGNTFKLVYKGAIDNNTRDALSADKKYVEQAIDALLSNKPIPTTKTKAIGCGIKYRDS